MAFLRCIYERYFTWLGLLLVVQAVGITAVHANPVVFDVRSYDHGDKTRFVIDLSEEVNYKFLRLPNPYRIVIDLPPLNWQAPLKRESRKEGLIASFHHGLFNAGTYRVVINLKSSAVVKKLFMLPREEGKPYRLVVDLIPSSRRAMLSSRAMEPIRNHMNTRRPLKNYKFAAPGRKPEFVDVPQIVVVIDPGHGGIDPGATTKSGIFEKNVVLAAAKAFKERLERSGRYLVYLTRNGDNFLKLRKRIEIAGERKADLFISLHADAMKNRRTRGMSVYTLSEKASSKEAAALARQENSSDRFAGIIENPDSNLKYILFDLNLRRTMNDSTIFANHLIKNFRSVSKVLPNPHRHAGFAVLKTPDNHLIKVSVLIELGFLSNKAEVRALLSANYRARLANAFFNAVNSYCKQFKCSG